MKKWIVLVLTLCMLAVSVMPAAAEETTLTGNAQIIYEAIRGNMNLPKNSTVMRAEEYLYKLTKDITLRALLLQVTQSEDIEMMYGEGSRIVVIDLDTGEVIDFKNYDGNVIWPEGDVASKYDALHLLYNSYWGYADGNNEWVMGEHEFVTPLEEAEIASINAALAAFFGF